MDLQQIKLKKVCANKFCLLLLWKLNQIYICHKTPSTVKVADFSNKLNYFDLADVEKIALHGNVISLLSSTVFIVILGVMLS